MRRLWFRRLRESFLEYRVAKKTKSGQLTLGDAPLFLPEWLACLDEKTIVDEPFPLREILAGSLYYPACGNDGGPVKYLGRWFHSFVYVDYRYGRENFINELETRPFSKYQVLGRRGVSLCELVPNGWSQPRLTETEAEQATQYADRRSGEPFCEWVVMERNASAPENHGPARFSLLYLNADGAAAYEALYTGNALCAGAIAVIQPGHGFGFNWTDFTDPQAVLARVVMGNPAGVPDVFVFGGMGSHKNHPAPWPGYSNHLGWYPYGGIGNVGVWGRAK